MRMTETAYQLSDQSASVDSGNIRAKPRAARLGSRIFSDQTWNRLAFSLEISDRQLEIVRYVFDDLTEFAISLNLEISLNTVHTHIRRLHHKLKVRTRVQLVLRVTQEFLELNASHRNALSALCAN